MKPTSFTGTLRSPCISVCRMEPDTGYCAGCHRTIEEIADWGMMSDERKRSVWQQIGLRRALPEPTLPPESLLAPSPDPSRSPDTARSPGHRQDLSQTPEHPTGSSRPETPEVTPAPGGEGR